MGVVDGTIAPNVAVVLTRSLKDGVTFEEFYAAWKPPITGRPIKDKMHVYSYYDKPVGVINAQNKQNPKEIISIALIQGTEEDVETYFSATMQQREATDALREQKILPYVEPDAFTNKYSVILSDDVLGV